MFDQKFSQDQHEQILKAIEKGDLKQFQLVQIQVPNTDQASTFAKEGGNRGVFEIEGNGLIIMPSLFRGNDPVRAGINPSASDTQALLYIAFNRTDAPWLPFSAPNAGIQGASLQGVCCTFRRFFVFRNVLGIGASSVINLLVVKGVNIYGAGYPQITGSYF